MGLADNYWFDTKSPLDAMLGGVNSWQVMKQNDSVLEQNRIANQAAQDKANYLKQAQQEAQTLDYNDPNAIRQFIAKYESSGITKGMTDYVANLDDKDRQTMLADTSKAISLLRGGDGANAAQFARDKALAYKNAGMASKAAEYEQMAAMMESHPDAALQSLQMNYAVLLPKDAAGNIKDFVGAYTPTVKDINSGGEIGGYVIDPITGDVTYKKLVDTSVSPDEQLRANTSITNNTNDNETRVTTANIAADTSRYAADKSSETGIRVANINGQFGVQKEQISQQGANYRTQAQIAEARKKAEVKEVGGLIIRQYADGSVDVVGKAQPKQDASTLGKVADIQSMNDSANQTIAQLKKAKELSRQGIYSGYGASGRADAMGSVPFLNGTEKSKRTQEYTNIIVNSALQSLKAVFGGAPTEGERAMLIKVQASADYPQEVREKILDQAIEMAQAKIASNNRQIGTLTGQQPSYPQASAPPTGIAKPQQSQGGYIGSKYK